MQPLARLRTMIDRPERGVNMKVDVKIPEVGESVQEAILAEWFKHEGDRVAKDDVLFVLETDKVTLEIAAEADGVLHIEVDEGETVAVGSVVATIETDAEGEKESPKETAEDESEEAEKPEQKQASEQKEEQGEKTKLRPGAKAKEETGEQLSPAVRRLVADNEIDVSEVSGTGPDGRVTKGDVLLYLEKRKAAEGEGAESKSSEQAKVVEEEISQAAASKKPSSRDESAEDDSKSETAPAERTTRKTMTPIRRRIAERLLAAKQNTAMLTTFNEIDMSRLQAIRSQFKKPFDEKYGVSLGLMSFFIKATIVALKEFPEVNASIDGKDIVYHHYYHVGVAIGSERGLVVPVIRHADQLGFAEIERAIVEYVAKIKENRLQVSDLEGGTFTISNGGVYGSLLSTPILNAPQSGILGMHKIEDRPVVVDGQIVIRPMMYVALSYDHRIVDGREAVTFLRRIKEGVENPERIMMEI